MGKIHDDDDDSRTNTSPTNKKPLTPTKDHPLMDLVNAKPPRGEFMDSDSDENNIMVVVDKKDDAVVDCSDKKIKHDEYDVDVNLNIENNFIENSQISTPPPSSCEPTATESEQIITTSTLKNVDDEKNNNTRVDTNGSDDEAEKQKLTVDKVVRRKKSPSRVNNNNIKNNNRMSYPTTRDRSQPSEIVMTKSAEKIDGKMKEER